MQLSDAEKKDVTLLCFAEVILCRLVNRAKVGSRRANKLNTAIKNLALADETYKGYLPPEYQAQAESTLEMIESELQDLYIKDSK